MHRRGSKFEIWFSDLDFVPSHNYGTCSHYSQGMRQPIFHLVAICAATTNAYVQRVAPWQPGFSLGKSLHRRSITWLYASREHEFDVVLEQIQEVYPMAKIVTIELKEHKPLGCTVEESLDTQNDPSVVFVSKIVGGGNAEKAGVLVGDVLVGVSGLFGEISPTWRSGVEKM